MFWCVSFRLGAFVNVSLLNENAPNSCFGAFLSVWVHLGPFRYCTKLAAKCAKLVQLMQKFVPRSRVRIFHNDTPDPHRWTLNSCFGAFLSVWVQLEPFCYYTKFAAKRAKQVQLMQKFVPRCLVRIFRN
jgi:hypothetical protein